MRSHILSFILVFLFIQTAQAQEEEKEKKFQSGIHFTPAMVNQVFKKPSLGEGNQSVGFNLGINFFYKLTSKIELKAGISGQLVQFQQSDYSITLPCDANRAGFDYSNSWFKDHYKIQYLGIPIAIRLKHSERKNHFYTKLGIESQFKIGSHASRKLVECRAMHNHINLGEDQANQAQNIVVLARLGLGYEFNLADGKQMYIEPEASYTLNPIFKNAPITNNSRLLNLGIVLGVKM